MGGERCCVKDCESRKAPFSKLSFHFLPTHPKIREKWIAFCNQPNNWTPRKYSSVCALHFKKTDYIMRWVDYKLGARTRKSLKKIAVPSIEAPTTPQSPPTGKKEKGRKRQKENIDSRNSSDDDEEMTMLRKEFEQMEKQFSSTMKKYQEKELVSSEKSCKESDPKNKNSRKKTKLDSVTDIAEIEILEFVEDERFELHYASPERKADEEEKETEVLVNEFNDDDDDGLELDTNIYENEELLAELQNHCRICLESNNLIHFTKRQSLMDLFQGITEIEVEADDEVLPKFICRQCIEKLEDISNFILMAKKNDAELRDTLLLNRDEKEESPDLDCEATNSKSSEFKSKLNETMIGKPLKEECYLDDGNELDKEERPPLKDVGTQSVGKNGQKPTHTHSEDESTERKWDCKCLTCGQMYRGVTIPKDLAGVPARQIKFQCVNCSKKSTKAPEDAQDVFPVKKNDLGDPPKVYPGRAENKKHTKLRCGICAEFVPLNDFMRQVFFQFFSSDFVETAYEQQTYLIEKQKVIRWCKIWKCWRKPKALDDQRKCTLKTCIRDVTDRLTLT
ncbi:hypothetical protein JTB14_028429 [Gonioctena quinquepunctata]|nr:hypothetical protein JTB14_028429 [Gonioctena quinquepunctata]